MLSMGVETVDNMASKEQQENYICAEKPWRKLGSK